MFKWHSRVHILIIGYVIVALFIPVKADESSQSNDKTAQEDNDSDDDYGRLVIFPEMPDDYNCNNYYCSSVYLMQGNKLIAQKITSFKWPVVFDKVPTGNINVDIRVDYGLYEKPAGGIEGRGSAIVSSGEITKIRINMTIIDSCPLTIQVLDTKHKPIPEQNVTIFDYSTEYTIENNGSCTVTTDADGRFKIYAYPDHKYKCLVKRKAGQCWVRYRSDVFQLSDADDQNIYVWKLQPQKKLILKFVPADGHEHLPVDKIKSVYFMPIFGEEINSGFGVNVTNRKAELSMTHPWLKGADGFKVRFNMSSLRQYFVIEKNKYGINDKPLNQIIRIKLIPPRFALVTYKTSLPSVRCYMTKKKPLRPLPIVLKDGQNRKLPFGDYCAHYWKAGNGIGRHTFSIQDREPKVVRCNQLPEGNTYHGTVVNASGAGMNNVRVDARYTTVPYGPKISTTTDKNGHFTMVLDTNSEIMCSFVPDKTGGRLVKIAESDDVNMGTIAFNPPIPVSGRIVYSEAMQEYINKRGGTSMRLFVYDTSCHYLPVYQAFVDNHGRYTLPLQPGSYDFMLFYGADVLFKGGCTVASNDDSVSVEDIALSEKEWEDARTNFTPPVRLKRR